MPSEPPFRLISAGELIPGPINTHTAVVRPNARIIHTAGQVGTFLDGSVPSTYPEQIERALWNLEAVLIAGGASPRDVLKLTYYIVNYDHKNRPHAPIIASWLKGMRPVTTLVPVPALAVPSYLFEIEAVAAVRDPSTMPEFVRPPPQTDVLVDAVVVGAGLSGLQAAYDLQKAGYSCLVLEARDRVGGKTWTVPVNGGKSGVDVGAAWINSVNQSRMWGLAQRFGLETVEQLVRGDCMSQEAGRFPYGGLPGYSKEDQDNLTMVRDKFEELCHTIDTSAPSKHKAFFNDMSVTEFVRALGGSDTTLATITVWTRVMNGKEPHEVGALYFLDYIKCGGGLLVMRSDTHGGGQHLRLRHGTQNFSKGLAASLRPGTLLLSTPVVSIKQSAGAGSQACTVVAADGTRVLCRKVIVSVPTPLYADIEFSPALSAAKTALASRTSLGFLSKVILVYAQPWWRARGFNGLTQSFNGPVSIARDTSIDLDGAYSLTCFLVGQVGLDWAALPTRTERTAVVVNHIAEIFGGYGGAPPEPTEVIIQIWNDEQWSKGGPSPVMGAGVMEAYGEALRAPSGNVHFVGTETSEVWKGYMEGAVRSGERGATEVIDLLQTEDKDKVQGPLYARL